MAEIDLGRVVGPPGTTDYNGTENRPSINGTTLEGNKAPAELGLAAAEEGMGLSHNDYTDVEKEKLSGIDEGANNYTHPETHPASMIVQDSTRRFVSDAKQREWDAVYAQAVAYVNLQIAALTDGAPEDMNTLKEIARAMRENADVLEVLREAVAKKANEIELAALAFSGSWDDLSDKPPIPGAMAGASAGAAGKGGTVPAPAKGAQGKYLRGDGTWQNPPNTTYGDATQSKNGLMSAADKKKLDGLSSLGQVTESIRSSITTGSWSNANKGANVIIVSTAEGGGWTALAKMDSQNGVFHLGVWKDAWYLNYTEKSAAEGTENKCTKQAVLMNEAGNMIIPGTIQAESFTGKFTTPRKIELKGDVTGSVNFDGGANVAVNAVRRSCVCGHTAASDGAAHWYRVAAATIPAAGGHRSITFLVKRINDDQADFAGILSIGAKKSKNSASLHIDNYWSLCGKNTVLLNFVTAYSPVTADSAVEFWVNITGANECFSFTVLSESSSWNNTATNVWTLYNTQNAAGSTAPTAGYIQKASGLEDVLLPKVRLWNGHYQDDVIVSEFAGDENNNYGTQLIVKSGGNMFIGAGESVTALKNALAAGPAAGEAYAPGGEKMYVTSDGEIFFYSGANNIASRKGIVLDGSGFLRPLTAHTLSLGTQAVPWKTVYGQLLRVSYNNKQCAQLAVTRQGTANTASGGGTVGVAQLAVGNNIAVNSKAVSGTNAESGADNSRGEIVMYGTGTGYTLIYPGNNGNGNITLTLPGAGGTLARTADLLSYARCMAGADAALSSLGTNVWFNLFKVNIGAAWRGYTLLLSLAPANAENNKYDRPCLVYLMVSSNASTKTNPKVYADFPSGTAAANDYPAKLLDNFYVCQLDSSPTGDVEVWFKQDANYQVTEVQVLSVAARTGRAVPQVVMSGKSQTKAAAPTAALTNHYCFKDIVVSNLATQAQPGYLSAADKKKLDGTPSITFAASAPASLKDGQIVMVYE